MKVLAEIQVIPLGVGVSLRKQVQRAHDLIISSGMTFEAHAYGTNVEGEMDEVLAVIKQIHETLHAEGTTRIGTAIKISSRTDKDSRLADKKLDSTPKN